MTDIFNSSVTFESLGLRSSVLKGIEAAGFNHPTEIQAQLIPAALTGRDLIGQAKTGTGKTAAFGLPLLHLCDKDTPMQALILVPTRELAAQVAAELQELGKFTPIRASCIIGGESMREQVRSLQKGGHILVGTPGRVMDLQSRGQITFDHLKYIVLDEVDRMLDIGFRDDIRKILKLCKNEHQTIFVSATISEEIERLARSFMKPDAQKLVSVSGSLTVSQVEQYYITVEPWDKKAMLLYLLTHEEPDTTVVFCRTKATVHNLTKYLREHKVDVREIHGDLSQQKRNKVMESMRSGKLDVLVASDLAARGLDIDHISHVINYDLPEDPEVYVHRIGRTARAGRKGLAWSFVPTDQGRLLTEIEKLIGLEIARVEYSDFKPGPLPADVREERERARQKPADPEANLAQRTKPIHDLQELSAEQLAAMFPGGIVPKGAPLRTLGSKLRGRKR